MISLAGPPIRGTIKESRDPDAAGRDHEVGGAISWFGLKAVYTPRERADMAEIAAAVRAGRAERSELEVLHGLKALLAAVEVEFRSGPLMTDDEANAYVARWNAGEDAPETETAPQRGRRGAVSTGQGSVFS